MTDLNAKIETTEKELKELSKMYTQYCNGVNEGGDGFNPYGDKIDVATSELSGLLFERDWTLEKTKVNRVIWNDAAKAHAASGGVMKVQQVAGFRFSDLKKAVDLHGLKKK
jgi:hypothetical protein